VASTALIYDVLGNLDTETPIPKWFLSS